MRLELHIALRYLFSKKSHNAINIVSGVSAAAVAVVTAVMVCVLSVMNGFGDVIADYFSHFDPELRIEAVKGKTFFTDTAPMQSVYRMESVDVVSEIVRETALVEFENRQIPAQLMGVDTTYQYLTQIDSIMTDGKFQVWDGAFERAVLGQGLAWQLGVNAHFVEAIHIYAPKRHQRVNLMRPDKSFHTAHCFASGVFAVNQVEYDDHLMLVSLPLARELFEYEEHEVTAVELKLVQGADVSKTKAAIRTFLGPDYKVLDRYEQQADFFHILKVEKWLTALLLAFIMLIATFNLIGSLTMLMLDKKADTQILSHLGADNAMVRRIFLFEGWLISILGAIVGLVIGVGVCLSQQWLGWLTLGNGSEYILTSYPVSVQVVDLLFVAVVVLGLGFVASWYPTRQLMPSSEQ